MSTAWVVGAILVVSIVLQLAAALVAIVQVRHADRFRFAWICVSLALFLMVERRVEPLLLVRDGADPRWINNTIGLVISVFMAIGLFGLRSLFQTLRRQDELLRQLAATDPLTGLANRRALYEQASREIRLSRRSGEPLTLFMIDLDYFKQVNDRYGHAVGDAALVRVAEKLRASLRDVDHVGRWGGEEFVALLPGVDAAGAMRVAERVRREIAGDVQGVVTVTVSVGVTVYLPDQHPTRDTLDLLVEQADCALYRAKQEGRNCIRLYAPKVSEAAQSASMAVSAGTRPESPGTTD